MDGLRAFYYEGRDGWVRLVSQREFDRLLKAAEVNHSTRIRYDEGDTELPAAQHPATASIFDSKVGVTDKLVDPMEKLAQDLDAAKQEASQAELRAAEAAASAKKEADERARIAKAAGQQTESQTRTIKQQQDQIAQADRDRAAAAARIKELERQIAEQQRLATREATATATQKARPVRKMNRAIAVASLALLIGLLWVGWGLYQRTAVASSNGEEWRTVYAALSRSLLASADQGSETRGSIPRGNALEARLLPPRGEEASWFEVRSGGDLVGYLPASAIRDTPPPRLNQLVGERWSVKQGANIRTEPRLGSSYVAGSVNTGDDVFVVGTINRGVTDNNEWAEIIIADGHVRYMVTSRLQSKVAKPPVATLASDRPEAPAAETPAELPAAAPEVETPVASPNGTAPPAQRPGSATSGRKLITGDGVRVRSGPSISSRYDRNFALYRGDVVRVVRLVRDTDPASSLLWYEISSPKTGYVAADYVAPMTEPASQRRNAPTSAAPVLKPVDPGLVVRVKSNSPANVRISPSTESSAIGERLKKGTILRPVGITTDERSASIGNWYKIEEPVGGYVAAWVVESIPQPTP